MINLKLPGTFTGAGLVSALAASICCVTPVIALLAGTSGIAATFSWLEPARPYLIVTSVSVLALAWYVKLKPLKGSKLDCDCETEKKPSFFQSKAFLGMVTVFALLMLAFPLYAKIFYPTLKINAVSHSMVDNKEQVQFNIQGMSCEACELEVNNELSNVIGVIAFKTSYENKNSIVTFDKSKVDIKTIETAIGKTGYKVKSNEIVTKSKLNTKASADSCCKKNIQQ